MPHRRLHNALAPLLVAALGGGAIAARESAPAWIDRSGLPAHHTTVAVPKGSPIGLTIASSGSSAAVARLTQDAERALLVLVDWLGPPSTTELTVVDLPWGVDVPGASYPGAVATRLRRIALKRDVSAERSLIAALARQFWFLPGDATFREALSIYTATRAIHAVLGDDRRNAATLRFAGAFIALPIHAIDLSANRDGPGSRFDEFDEVLAPADAPWRFASVGEQSPSRRAFAALRTLERRIGWPAIQQALVSLREQGGAIAPESFATVLGGERGVSMDWFVRDLVRSDGRIDYAVGSVSSETTADGMRTHMIIERRDRGMFSGTDQPRAAAPAQSLTASIRFADGSEARAPIDGRDERTDIIAESTARPVLAIVDPDELVLVDADRSNNAWAPDPPRDRVGLRLVANWIIWLQNVMLTYTAIA